MAKVTTDAIKQIADHVVIRMEKKSGLCKSFDGAYFSRMCIVVCKQSSRPVKVNLSEGGQSVIVACFPPRVKSVRNAVSMTFQLEWNT